MIRAKAWAGLSLIVGLLAGALAAGGGLSAGGAGLLAAAAAAGMAFRAALTSVGPHPRRWIGSAALRVALGLGLAAAGAFLLRTRAPAFSLSQPRSQRLELLVRWAEKISEPLGIVVLGPPGHRKVRAAEALLRALAVARPEIEVEVRNLGDAGALPGMPRPPRIGEVLLRAGGRRALVPDASIASLASGLRGLSDQGFRGIRFLAKKEAPGGPPGFRKAAARLASTLAAQVTSGPTNRHRRVWIWTPGAPDPASQDLEAHVQAGGSLLILAGSDLPPSLAAWLEARGLALAPGWILDDEAGPTRERASVRVRRNPDGRAPAALPGLRPVRVAPGAVALLVPVAGATVDRGRDPDAGGPTEPRPPGWVAGVLHEPRAAHTMPGRPARAWVALVGDADFASDAGLRRPENRLLLSELGALAMDRELGLPDDTWVPMGGVDPDLHPALYRKVAFLLLVGFPGLAMGLAGAAAFRSAAMARASPA